jgi:large subunit ribosomal protein L10
VHLDRSPVCRYNSGSFAPQTAGTLFGFNHWPAEVETIRTENSGGLRVVSARGPFSFLDEILGERRNSRLAITKAQKVGILQGYMDILAKAQGMIVTEYRGMGMKNFNAIRAVMRQNQGGYTVTKNTLFKIALDQNGFAVPEDLLSGPTAVAIAYGDIGGLTKALLARQKEDELLILKGAIVGKTIYRKEQLEALSTLPSLDEARATLIGTLQQPATRIVGLFGQPATGLAALLKAYTDEQGAGSQSEAA